MTIVKLLLIGAMVLAPCAALYARWGWSAAKSLPLSLCAQSLILYIFGLFLPFSCCVAILCVICLSCGVYFLARVGGIRRLLGFVSVPGVLFVLGIPLLYYACCDRLYLSYDEYSHWGLIIKVISLYDELPRAGAGAPLLLYNYPPAGAMLPSLCAAVLGYREGVAYFGYALLLWGLLLGLIPEKGGAGFKVLAAAVLFFCLMALFPFAILRLFSEPLIALTLALLVVQAWAREKARGEEMGAAVLTAFLALTKNSALVFVALYLLVRLCVRWEKRERKRCAGIALCALTAYGTYAVYACVQGIEPAFASHIAQNLRALLNGTLDESHLSAPARFIRSFFTTAFPQSGVYSCYAVGTSPAVLYAAELTLCAAQAALARERRAVLRLWLGLWGGTAVYIVSVMLSYVLVFTPQEAARLSEMDRYLSLPALYIGLIWCALTLREAAALGARARGAIGCALTAALLPLSHPSLVYETLVTRSTVRNTQWGRIETDAIAALLRAHVDLSTPQKVRLIGTCDAMALRYEMIAQVDWGHPSSNWNEADFVGTAQGLSAEIVDGGYAYVVTGRLEHEDSMRTVDARYAPLFAGGEAAIQPFSLYRVEYTADGVQLVWLGTAEIQ